jgi:hypothetical protein
VEDREEGREKKNTKYTPRTKNGGKQKVKIPERWLHALAPSPCALAFARPSLRRPPLRCRSKRCLHPPSSSPPHRLSRSSP